MNLTVHIPDNLASRLSAAGGDLSRRALEAFALEEFKSGHLTKPELRQLLGYETRAALDGFLKAHAARGGGIVGHWSGCEVRLRRSKIRPVVRHSFVLWMKGSRRNVYGGGLRGGPAICFH